MLSDAQLEEYFDTHGLVATAREYITYTRSSPPFRRVGDHALKNVCIQFASRKMGRSIQAESRTAEYAFALEFEYATDVLEFWDQPAPVPVTRTMRDGRSRTSSYTPDFLILTSRGPCVVEVKAAGTLPTLLETNPNDWRVVDDVPRYAPAFDAYQRLGLRHWLALSDSISKLRSANLRLLLQARQSVLTPTLINEVRTAFDDAPLLTLQELSEALGVTDVTPILKLIDEARLYARLGDDLLSQPSTCWLSMDESKLAFVPQVLQFQPTQDSPRLPSRASMVHFVDAMERLQRGARGRSERRWMALRRQAEKTGQDIVEALRPKFERCGNRTPRLHPKCEQFVIDFIEQNFASSQRLGLREAFRAYELEAEEQHPEFPPVSYATFRSRLLRRDKERIAFGRGGRRAANAASLPTEVDLRALKATRAFELAGLDHYDANIQLFLGEANGKRFTARPWISLLIDYCTRLILAVWVSFAAPSSRSCAIVLRRCVREHHRLPEMILVDRGPDFRSLYFMSTLASTAVHLAQRPAGHGRFGAEVERPFGLFQTEWLPYLPGNFAHVEEARSISRSHSPAQTAEITIERFWASLLDYIQQRNNSQSDFGKESPTVAHTRALATFSCSGVRMHETPEFIVDTAVDVRKVRLEESGYIRLNERRRFWCPELASLQGRVRTPEVREEPENPHICYVNCSGRWVTAKASGAPMFQTLDPITRLAESLRISECNSARIELREEAQKGFIRSQQRLQRTGLLSTTPELESTSVPVPAPRRSIFDEVKHAELQTFSDVPSEVMKYVMGKGGQ